MNCPKCGKELRIAPYSGGKAYPFSDMPFYRAICDHCDFYSPVGCGDYGEASICLENFLKGSVGEYDADDGNIIIIYPKREKTKHRFQLGDRVADKKNRRIGIVYAVQKTPSEEIQFVIYHGDSKFSIYSGDALERRPKRKEGS